MEYSQELPRIGLFARDPLRIEGLRAMLGDGSSCSVSVLLSPRARDLAALDLVVIDVAATEQLLALIAVFLRSSSKVRLLVLGVGPAGSTHDPDELDLMEQVLEAGARGYLSRSLTAAELWRAVTVVLDGSMWAPRKVLTRLLERARIRGAEGEEPRPSRREVEVLRLLVGGSSNREIGLALRIGEGTVKSHLSRLMRKAGATNRTELTMRALSGGWIEAPKRVPKRE